MYTMFYFCFKFFNNKHVLPTQFPYVILHVQFRNFNCHQKCLIIIFFPLSAWGEPSTITGGNCASIPEKTKPLKASSPKKITTEESLLAGLKNLNIKEDVHKPLALSAK